MTNKKEIDTFYKMFPQYRSLEKELKKVAGNNIYKMFKELPVTKKIRILDDLAHHLGL